MAKPQITRECLDKQLQWMVDQDSYLQPIISSYYQTILWL